MYKLKVILEGLSDHEKKVAIENLSLDEPLVACQFSTIYEAQVAASRIFNTQSIRCIVEQVKEIETEEINA